MRLPFDWLFGALRVPPMFLLSVPLLCALAVFGQTAAPAPGQAPSYPAKDIAGFQAYFMQVMALESSADRLKTQGKDDTTVRGAIQKSARLSAQETSLLKEVAQQCNTAYAAQAAAGASAVSGLRQQYPPVAGTPPPTAVTQQLAALQAQRDAIIAGCMQQLRAGMGTERFLHLDLYVMVHVAAKQKQGHLQPGAQAAAAPR